MSVENVSGTTSVYHFPGLIGKIMGDLIVTCPDEKDGAQSSGNDTQPSEDPAVASNQSDAASSLPAIKNADPIAPNDGTTANGTGAISPIPAEQKPLVQEQNGKGPNLPVAFAPPIEKPASPDAPKDPLAKSPSDGQGVEGGEKKAPEQKADASSSLPQQPVEPSIGGSAKKSNGEAEEKGSSGQKPSGEAFAQASPSVKAQLQQPELARESLSSRSQDGTKAPLDGTSKPQENIVREAESKVQAAPQPPSQTGLSPAPVPATGAIRDVPSIQEIVRSKIEDEVTQYPELSGKWGNLLSYLKGAVAEQKAGEIQKSIRTLLGILLPALSKERQAAYLLQLENLHQDIVRMITLNDTNLDDYLAVATVLSDQLKQLVEQATSDISSIASRKPREEVGIQPSSGSGVQPSSGSPDKKGPTVIPLPGGQGRKHRRGNKGR